MNLEYPLGEGYFAFKHIEIIKCKQPKIIIIGWNSSETEYYAIIIHKIKQNEELKPLRDIFEELGPFETNEDIKKQINARLGLYHEKETIYACGIMGFHKFLQGYYLMYIKQNEPIAKIGRHKIYEIKSTEIIPLFDLRGDDTEDDEKKYLQILKENKLQNYYYSYTYDMTNSLAKNMVKNARPLFGMEPQKHNVRKNVYSQTEQFEGVSELFQYNYKMIDEFYPSIQNKKWIIVVVHGYCKHINIKFKGTIFNVVVIARRSRHHAGTRYIKRGISKDGFAANFVEVEQIVVNFSSSQDTRPVCSSFVQVRGSVPTYWMQKPSIAIPKPAIEIRSSVDYMYVGTRKHFHDMVARYGRIVYCINLMKMKQKVARQSELSKQYQNAITFINKNDLKEENAIHYIEVDMKYHLKLDKKMFINKIKTFAYFTILRTGIFLCMNHSTSSHEQFIEFQNGVIRANCVDCLDRTNSFQQLVGETLLAVQLNRLIGQDVKFQNLQLDETIIQLYSKLYEEMGDLISIQYGSSLAHKQKIQKTTESRFELWTSIIRHWNNNFNDQKRQMEHDIFLGYRPDLKGLQLWQTKPVIQHFPDYQAQSFQKFKKSEWFDRAYSNFLEDYCIANFEKITRKDQSDITLPKIEKLSKEYLINKFNAEIMGSLINEKEDTTIYNFFVMPKLIMEKRVWKEMNPRSKNPRTLQQELKLNYNRMDFLKNSENTNNHMSPIKMKDQKQPKRSNKNQRAGLNFDDSSQIMKDIETFIGEQLMDDHEIQMIERYARGEQVMDEQIQTNVDELYLLISEDINDDKFIAENYISEEDIAKQLKRIETNIASRNFVANSLEDTWHHKAKKKVEVKSLKNIEPKKKEVVRENKVKMLELIMTQNFSHGNINKITEV